MTGKVEKYWYNEFSLGLLKVSKVGYGFGFMIPKKLIDNGTFKYGDKHLVVVLKRVRDVRGELTKAEQVEFDAWKEKSKEMKKLELKENELRRKELELREKALLKQQ